MYRALFKSSLFRNVSWIFASSVVSNLLRFLLIFILIRLYSPEEFGLWASITSIAAILVTGDFGITNVLRYRASKAIEEKRVDDFKISFFSSLYFFLLFAIIVSIILVFISPYIPYEKLFKTDNVDLMLQGRKIFIIIQVLFLLGIPFGLGCSMFFSFNETKIYSIISFIQGCATFLIVVILGLFHCKISTVSICYFIINTIAYLGGTIWFIYRRKWEIPKISIKTMYLNMKSMLLTGIKFLSIQLSSSFVFNVLTLYSGALLGLTVAANINVIQKIYTFFVGIYQSINNPIWSSLASNYFSNNLKKCKEILIKICLITITVFTFIISFSYIFKDILIQIIAGSQYNANGTLFILVGLFYLCKVLFDNVTLLQNATNKINKLAFGYLIFDALVMFVVPYIMANYGLYYMVSTMIAIWALFSVCMAIESKYILSNKCK